MNIQLSNTEEFIDLKSTGSLGQVLIRYDYPACHVSETLDDADSPRCNNVLWISGAKGLVADEEMEG